MPVITLSSETFATTVSRLYACSISFDPDLIIGIKNGGAYIGREFLNNYTKKQPAYKEILLQRPSSSNKKNPYLKRVFKFLPYAILDKLRIIESLYLHRLKNNPAPIKLDFTEFASYQRILILDDAMDSGNTAKLVHDAIRSANNEVKIGVITQTLDCPVILPDFLIYKQVLIRFPWSEDYKGKDRFEKIQ